MFTALLIVFVSLLIYLWIKSTSKPVDFPPGPPRIPIFGSVLDMKNPSWGSKPSIFWGILQFEKRYGDIFGIYLGNMRTVVLTKYEDIKEVLNTDEASARPPVLPVEIRPGWEHMPEFDPVLNKNRPPGVILSNGNYWREQRRYVLRNLRDFGFGKASMEDSLNEEVKKLVDHLRPKANAPLNLNKMVNISILNALWHILVGERLELSDPKLNKTLGILDDFIRSAEGPTSAVANIIPFPKLLMMPVFKKLLGIDALEKVFLRVTDLIKPSLVDHKATLDENNIRDFMDLYLTEINNTSDPMSSFYKHKGESSLVNVFIDLFLAGTETTSSTLLWTFLYLLHFPEWQDKIVAEIEEQTGMNKLPSFDDRPKMHMTNAFMLETMRHVSFVPISVFHYTHSDIKIGRYTIPKDSAIISSLYHVNHNPDFFPQPEVFKPERFLDNNGQFVNDERVSPFGIGKRFCLGKSLAEKEYFLFLTGILQAYKVCPVPGQALPKYGMRDVPVPGLTRNCPAYEMIFKPRE